MTLLNDYIISLSA